MNYFNVVVARNYQITDNGKTEERTDWKQVGRAWYAKSGESLHVELFLLPGQRYLIPLSNRKSDGDVSFEDFEKTSP